MANRTAVLVFATALVMVVASLSVRTESAYAHQSDEAAIDQIYSIKTDAWASIGAVVAAAGTDFDAASSEAEAMTARDRGYGAIEDRFWEGASDMWWVAENAHWVDPVEDAFWDAVGALEGRANQANAEVAGMYDSWVAAHSVPTAEAVIAEIEQKLRNGLNKIAGILDDFADELSDADDQEEAEEARDEALSALESRVATTTTRLGNQLALLPDDPAVQDAYAAAIDDLNGTAAAAAGTIDVSFNQWVASHSPATTTTTTPPPTTTTTKPPPTTTTTRPAATTTTVTPTTTTTVAPPTTTTIAPPTTTTTTPAPAALLPPTEPPAIDLAYMTEPPAAVVLSASVTSSQMMAEDSAMATVGLVRRVVDSQLPAGVSMVAAGPLVVLGLIVDAILAAGALMAIPWLLLGIYMVGLLRQSRAVVEAPA